MTEHERRARALIEGLVARSETAAWDAYLPIVWTGQGAWPATARCRARTFGQSGIVVLTGRVPGQKPRRLGFSVVLARPFLELVGQVGGVLIAPATGQPAWVSVDATRLRPYLEASLLGRDLLNDA